VPLEIIETLNRAFAQAMSTSEMRAAFERGGMVPPRYNTLEDAKAWLRDEMASWKRDVEELGIVVEE
jgi:tripartite-type tricarboxylate transporter receptor subunit TctC